MSAAEAIRAREQAKRPQPKAPKPKKSRAIVVPAPVEEVVAGSEDEGD